MFLYTRMIAIYHPRKVWTTPPSMSSIGSWNDKRKSLWGKLRTTLKVSCYLNFLKYTIHSFILDTKSVILYQYKCIIVSYFGICHFFLLYRWIFPDVLIIHLVWFMSITVCTIACLDPVLKKVIVEYNTPYSCTHWPCSKSPQCYLLNA